MQLTDAQYRLLDEAAARGDNEIARGVDANERTLRSMAAHRVGILVHQQLGRRKVVTGLTVTTAGWRVYGEEARRREEAARIAANARGARLTESDPFAVHAQSAQARREAAIDAAFAI
jgi:hypothetical protein